MSALYAALPPDRLRGSASGFPRRFSRVVALLAVACVALSTTFAASAGAAPSKPTASKLTIVAAYDSSVSSLPNFAAIQAAINTDITNTEALVTTIQPMTVTITFGDMPDGLGQSVTGAATIPYSLYLSRLKANPTKMGLQTAAIKTMPAGPNTGINGATQVFATAAGLTELGIFGGEVSARINLNFSILDPIRPNGANLYDLQTTAQHEMDEILGIGGLSSTLGAGVPDPDTAPLPTAVGPMDLFRYHAPNVRSFTYSTNTTAYFSINSGQKDLTDFNQQGGLGSDYADWKDSSVVQVQDNSLPPGGTAQLGRNELISFLVVGYNLTRAGQNLLDSSATQTFAPLASGQARPNAKTM